MHGRASSTATASTARTSRRTATASTRTRSSSIRTPSRSARTIRWADALFGYRVGDPRGDLSFDDRDNAAFAPLAAVVDPAFTWGDDRPPRTPWHKTLIYELHVKGFTMLHPDVPEHAARHLRRAGVGAGAQAPARARRHRRRAAAGPPPRARPPPRRARPHELLGLQHASASSRPTAVYAASQSPAGAVREFKLMVRALHAAGIEVILDVVYNHTAEGNQLGPTLSLRGSTTPPTTACRRRSRATTWTSPAAATR